MKAVDGITLNGRFFSRQWILHHFENLRSPEFTPDEILTLTFCGQWLSGQTSFTVQTSGSTGPAKPVRIERAQMALSARLTGQALDLKRGDRALVCLSPAHIGGIMMLVRGFELSLHLTVVEPSSNPFERLEEFDQDLRVSLDFTAMVPLQLQQVLDSKKKYRNLLNQMKAILIGGAPISVALLQQLLAVKAPVYHTFGMTETVSHIALRPLNGAAASDAFRPLPGVKVGTDHRGCLTIESAITGGKRVVTNDLVEILQDHRFVWLGRVDNVINSGGIKVQAEKVEKALEEVLLELGKEWDYKRAFFIGPLPHANLGEEVIAFFEGARFPSDRQKRIRALLSSKLSKYEVPRRFCFVDSFLRTENGKIDRRATLLNISVVGRDYE
ncbi:MAG: AMP-binding protein [bacterium]